MNKFTVIIPTMWCCDYIYDMLAIYDRCEFVDEIIIIDNQPNSRKDINFNKINLVTKGHNIFVNPAWNLGVLLSKNESILIANDDVLIDEDDFNNLITKINNFLTHDMVIGPDESCFIHNTNPTWYSYKTTTQTDDIQINESNGDFTYGFGTFMFMKQKSYTIIPEDILIFYGDNIQHRTNKPYLFTGVKITTKMSVTVHHDHKLHALASLDHNKILKYNIQELKKTLHER